MDNFSKEEIKTLHKLKTTVFYCKALLSTITDKMQEIEEKILKENEYYTCMNLNDSEPVRILKSNQTYRMSDSDFQDYLHLRLEQMKINNIPLDNNSNIPEHDFNPVYAYELSLKTAENILLEYMLGIVPQSMKIVFQNALDNVWIPGRNLRKELIELTLRIKTY
jgi:hypothetical protein